MSFLRTIIVINEPDLKIPGISKPTEFCRTGTSLEILLHQPSQPVSFRAIVSAIDGMIDAEKDSAKVV